MSPQIVWKVSDIIAALEADLDGWYQARMNGSHRVFKHPHKAGRVVVAGSLNIELAPGTLHAIFKQAGWSAQPGG